VPEESSGGGGGGGGMDGGDWQTLAALVLDAGLNKGRGVGQIAGAYASNQERNAHDKRAHKLKLEEINARKGNQDMADWAAVDRSQRDYEQMRQREEDRNVAIKSLGLREATRDDKLSPDSAFGSTKTELVKRGAAARVEGAETKKDELSDVIEGNAAGVTRARTNAATNAKNENPAEFTKDQVADNTRADRAREAQEKHTEAVEANTRETTLQRDTNSFRDKNKRLIQMAQAVQHIDSILSDPKYSKPGADKPGMGMWDSSSWVPNMVRSDDSIRVRDDLATLQEFLQTEVTGAAAPMGQEKRIQAIAGAKPGATERETMLALEILREHAKAQLRAAGANREGIARTVLGENNGLDKWVYGDDQAPPEVRQAQPQRGPVVDPLANSQELPVTTGKVPPLPGDATSGGQGKTSYRLQSPSGKTGNLVLSEFELAKYLAKGWKQL
jgi:hypothetical protein